MVMGATSLGLVRNDLFVTIEQVEQSLERFIAERGDAAALQQMVEGLQQLGGTLKLLQLAGAELLAREMWQLATDIPTGAGAARDGQLAALGRGLFVLRRYLESIDSHRQEIPELLLPSVNEVRESLGQPALPESFFFSVRLDAPRPPRALRPLTSDSGRRLRQMYQVGLLGVLRGEGVEAGLRLMERALGRLDAGCATRLCWIAAAALESLREAPLRLYPWRLRLLARIDRQLRQLLDAPSSEAPRSLLKELLYLVALGNGAGPRSREVRRVFALAPLPFSDALLAEAAQRLAGPGQAVMRSLAQAMGEELGGLKELLDLCARGSQQTEGGERLRLQLERLAKTLGMVGLGAGAALLHEQLPRLAAAPGPALAGLADVLLTVESMVAGLAHGEPLKPCLGAQSVRSDDSSEASARQFAEARRVVIFEARNALAQAKQAIAAYLDGRGDTRPLLAVPDSLRSVRGGLWFLGLERAGALVASCADYVEDGMLGSAQMPPEAMLETLADALSSLEFFLEGGEGLHDDGRRGVLDLAADSVRALGLEVAC